MINYFAGMCEYGDVWLLTLTNHFLYKYLDNNMGVAD